LAFGACLAPALVQRVADSGAEQDPETRIPDHPACDDPGARARGDALLPKSLLRHALTAPSSFAGSHGRRDRRRA
jgi:hypothetical protein